jgi:hypothetical protein
MNRPLFVVLALVGCTSEAGIRPDLPDPGRSVGAPLRDTRQVDQIRQVSIPSVDILWMVDNSCSMSNEQTDLTQNFPFFMDYFLGSGLDYHVGVTSSDTISSDYSGSSGTLVTRDGFKYIDQDTPNPVALFVSMATLGITGRFPERGLGGTYLALEVERDRANSGFYRDEAALHTIIISDEPDYTEIITQPEYADWYDALKSDRDNRSFSAIITPGRGQKYQDTVKDVGGIEWSLDQQNWPAVLDLLGLQAAGLRREYYLSQLPVPGTIEVGVENAYGAQFSFDETTDWTYDKTRNSIAFVEYIPEATSTVTIEYIVLSSQVEEVEEQ